MELLVTLGRTLGFSLAAGVNLYATVALIGLAARYDWVTLPPQFAVFDNPWVIGAAAALYAIEFVADKVPWIDTVWDTVHTFVRPLGGRSSPSPRSARPRRRSRAWSPCSGRGRRRQYVTKAGARRRQRQSGALLELGPSASSRTCSSSASVS